MKKYVKIVTLALALVLALAALTACGMSNNPKKTKKALESRDYTVEVIIGDGDLEAQAELDSYADEMNLTAGELVAMLTASKGEAENDVPENFIYIYYVKDSKSANKFWDSNQEQIEKTKETYKDAKGFEMKKSGSVVYFGTKQAINDAM